MSILQKIKNTVRSRSIHVAYVDVGSCNGCDIEVLACLAPRYDIEQYGIYVHNNPPREADVLLVIGSVTPPSGWTNSARSGIRSRIRKLPLPSATAPPYRDVSMPGEVP